MERPHVLVVSEFNPDEPTDCFEIEHLDDCPKEDGYMGCVVHMCLVGQIVWSGGIEMYFCHEDNNGLSEDDQWSRQPIGIGRHEVVAWVENGDRWGESDYGLELVEEERDLTSCPYWQSLRGGPPGQCDRGCWEEPACITDEPENGWPSQRKESGNV